MTNQISLDIEVLEPLLLMSASPLAEAAADLDVVVASGEGDLAQGTDANELLRGEGGDNVLRGGGGDDYLVPLKGDNVLDGGAGNDTAVYSGSVTDYEFDDRGFGISSVGRGDNVDFMTAVENIEFEEGVFSVQDLADGKIEPIAPASEPAPPILESAVPADPVTPVTFADAPEIAESLAPEPAEEAPEPVISELPFSIDAGETAVLEGNRADYTFEDQGFGIVAVRYGDSIDFLTSVDTVEFNDGKFPITELLSKAPGIVDGPVDAPVEVVELEVTEVTEVSEPTQTSAVETTDIAVVADSAPEYTGAQVVYSFDVTEPPGSDAAGDIERVSTNFNETTNEFSFRVVMTDASGDAETTGFTLAINDGPNPKGNGDEMALFYFDNSASEPVITAYNYNGRNDFSSWQDAPIVSSLASNSPFKSIEASTNANGEVVYSFSMDATSVVEFSNGASWTGVSFGESLGIWLHPQTNISSSYNADGYLESWSYDSHGWYDTKDRDTVTAIIDPAPPEPPVVGGPISIVPVEIDGSNIDNLDGARIYAQRVDATGEVVEPADLVVQKDGKIGVAGNPEAGVANQIGLNPKNMIAEQVVVETDGDFTSGSFSFSNLFRGEGDNRDAAGDEQAKWEAIKGGEVVATGTFVASKSHTGSVTIELPSGVTADRLAITPTEYSGGQNGSTIDSSDFFITSIRLNTVQVTDAPPSPEPPVVVDPPAPEPPVVIDDGGLVPPPVEVPGGNGDISLISMPADATAEVTFVSEGAGYRNSVGMYSVDPATGEISGVEMLFANASLKGSGGNLRGGETAPFGAPAGHDVGFFILANGYSNNDADLITNGNLSLVAGGENGGLKLVAEQPNGSEASLHGPVYVSEASLNPGGLDHFKIESKGSGFSVSIEDLPGLGDKDFNDVVLELNFAGVPPVIEPPVVIDPPAPEPPVVLDPPAPEPPVVVDPPAPEPPVDVDPQPTYPDVPTSTIAEVASGNSDFSILVKALQAADLVDAVNSQDASLTVFAPTNSAFGLLATDLGFTGDTSDADAVFDYLVGQLTELGGGDPVPVLKDILLYHVSDGAQTAAEVNAADAVATLQGGDIAPDGTSLGDADPDFVDPQIILEDVAASNGVIHAIDRVLLPIDIGADDPTPEPPQNDAPTANKDKGQVVASVPAPAPLPEPQEKTVQDVEAPSDADSIQLKMMEGSNTIFNFSTTTDVLSEDVWFAQEGDFNQGPTAGDDTFTAEDSGTVTGTLFGNDSDTDGDAFVVSAVNGISDAVTKPVLGSNGGTFVIDADGNVKFDAGDSFANLQAGDSAQTSVTYTIDDGNSGTDTATVTVLVNGGEENTVPICVKEQSQIVRGAYNNGQGREVTIDLSQSVMDADGDNLTYDLNFADQYFVEGTEKGKFGWEVKEFNADTGKLTLQIHTEKWEAWHYDAAEVSDVFVKAQEAKQGANWESGSAYQPFSFSVADEDGNQIDCNFKLQVFDDDYNSPVALDLNGDGQIGVTGETTSKDKSGISQVGQTVSFDIDNDGTDDQTEWYAGDGDGILVDNRDGNAANDMDGGRLFGDEGGKYANGYEKLAELDADGDGSLTGSELDGLAVWVDDGDAVVEAGEFRSLQDLGIFKLDTNMTLVQDADGRDLMQSTASMDAEAAVTVEYSISGADSALFEINEATGEMCFKQSPDFENPLDSDGDNVYKVTLERTINGVTSTQTVEIAICDKVADNSTAPTATATGNVLENDTDPNGDDLTAALVTGPQNGSVSLSAKGDYVYTPNPGFTGIDVFTYEVSDGNGGTDTTEVCIEVVPEGTPEPEPPPAPVNNAPDAVNDSTRTNVDVSVSGTVADNDTDLDGDTLTFSVKQPALNGAVALAEDGSYTYTPNAGFVGFDTFRYEVSDGNGGTDVAIVLIQIEPELVVDPPPPVVEPPVVEPPVVEPPVVEPPVVEPPVVEPPVVEPPVVEPPVVEPPVVEPPAPANQNPDAVDDNADTAYGTTVTGNVLTNDVDPDGDSLSVTLTTPPANGVAVIGPDGEYTYTPNAGFSGQDVFVYQVDDGNGGTDTATVTIEVADGVCTIVNGDPTAGDDSNTTTEDTPVSGSVADNDVDPDGDTLKFYVEQGPVNGSIEFNDDGTYTYTPDPGYVGTDTFTYEANDGRGGTRIATVTITVEEVPNLAPVAENDSSTTTMDSDVSGSVADNDSDPDGDNLTFYVEDGPANGSIVFNTDGTYTYTPDPGYVGTDTFTYEANDGNGGTAIATVTVTVEPGQTQCNGPLTPANADPEAVNDTNETTFNAPVSGNVLPNDVDGDGDLLTVTLTSQPSNGSVTLTADGDYTYTPNDGFEGVDVFSYEISDGNGGTDTAEVTITVTRNTAVSPDGGNREFDTTYINSGADGLIWGDPHFRGDDGGFYDVSGEAGSYYNLLSDRGLQLNAKFIDWKDSNTDEKGTVIGELGLTLGTDQLMVDLDGAQINGNDLVVNQETAIGNGGTINYDGTVTTVDTGEYNLTFTRQDGLFAVRIKVNNPFSDLVAPHGLWGQTVDSDAEARDGDYYKDNYVYGLQGGGALDRVDGSGNIVRTERGDDSSFQLYETAGLFSLTALNDDGNQFFRYEAATGTGLNRLS